jgi:hypothetical protein
VNREAPQWFEKRSANESRLLAQFIDPRRNTRPPNEQTKPTGLGDPKRLTGANDNEIVEEPKEED